MTLQQLNGHLDLVIQLQSARESLENLRAKILGATNYDGMPHSSETSRKTEAFAVMLERQKDDVKRLERAVANSETEVRLFVDDIADNRTKLIFSLRFLCGCKWEEVADLLGSKNTDDSVKHICYRYLESTGDA